MGALVLGTAFPSLIKGFNTEMSWQLVIVITSGISVLGGALMLIFVPNGPYRKRALKLNLSAVYNVFEKYSFKQAALGYFGHMWELYAFWTFVPFWLLAYEKSHTDMLFNIPILSLLLLHLVD